MTTATSSKRRRISTRDDVIKYLKAYEAGEVDVNPPRTVDDLLRRYCREMAIIHCLEPGEYEACVMDEEYIGWYALFEFINDTDIKVQTSCEPTINPFRTNVLKNCSLGVSSANSASCMWNIGLFIGPFPEQMHCVTFCSEWRKSRGTRLRYEKGLKLYEEWRKRLPSLVLYQGVCTPLTFAKKQ